MSDLTEFQRGMIVGARLVGASVTRVAELVGASKSTVSSVTSQYAKTGKTSADRRSCGRKPKLDSRDRRALRRIVARKHKTTAPQITAELNASMREPVSVKTVRRALHDEGIHGRAAIAKPLLTPRNVKQRVQWCKDHRTWTLDAWKHVIWSDESSFTVFPTSGRVYVWRSPGEAYELDCLKPTVKHGGGSCMVWGAMSWYSMGPIIVLEGKVTAHKYLNILADQVHPMVQTLFPDGDAIFQDDNAPIHTAVCVGSWFEEHESELTHLPWPAQSPDLNIIEPVWGILENKVRSRFPPPASIKELASALVEEWHKIDMNVVHDLYLSIPRRVSAVLCTKGGPTPY